MGVTSMCRDWVWPTLTDAGTFIDLDIVSPHDSGYTKIGQTTGAGLWYSIDDYYFPAGRDGHIELAEQSGGRLVAHAVRFELKTGELMLPPQLLADTYRGSHTKSRCRRAAAACPTFGQSAAPVCQMDSCWAPHPASPSTRRQRLAGSLFSLSCGTAAVWS